LIDIAGHPEGGAQDDAAWPSGAGVVSVIVMAWRSSHIIFLCCDNTMQMDARRNHSIAGSIQAGVRRHP
jgi:hypothetical protein